MLAWRIPRATLVVGGFLLLLTLVAWLITAKQIADMSMDMSMAGTLLDLGGASSLASFLPMWVSMMAAMMLPSAIPMVLVFDRISRGKTASAPPIARLLTMLLFVVGYLLTWAAFGVVAFAIGLGLSWPASRWPGLAASRLLITSMLLIAAGVYQLMPLKVACLNYCRAPHDFIACHWCSGWPAALRMGVAHGVVCVGSCWGLMLVLVAAGMMNLAWMGIATVLILIEKVLPHEQNVSLGIAALLVVEGMAAATGQLPGMAM